MQLTQIQIKNFRCFKDISLHFEGPIILIQGLNGSGKTSLLEALHYLCYLRSFRTHSPRELITFGSENFFIKAHIVCPEQPLGTEIQVGFAGKKRSVKVNQAVVSSYKELMAYYRIVTLTEDDLSLISLGPEVRRAFIDQALLLDDPEFIQTLRNFKHIVDSRNALFAQNKMNADSYELWTNQLLATSGIIQARRMQMLAHFESITNQLLQDHFEDQLQIAFVYSPKKIGPELDDASFNDMRDQLYHEELRFGRSLFGAHLDDFIIRFQDKKSKAFASRGQQKLIIILLKIAQMKVVRAKQGTQAVFLLDDFMTDFDPGRAQILLNILCQLDSQLIFTSPVEQGLFEENLRTRGARQIKLTH